MVRSGSSRWRWHDGHRMPSDVDRGATTARPAADARDDTSIAVALGRRVEVLGDLLLPPEPTDSSRAGCRDIARRLEEWQGPGVVILCGRLVAPVADDDQEAAAALRAHTTLVEALRTFLARPDSRVVAVLSPHHDPGLIGPLEKLGVSVYPAVDLVCETGAGIRTVLVRAGTLRPGAN